jgi:hypothetical protein
VDGDTLVDSARGPAGLAWNFVGKRAPILCRPIPKAWTTPRPLFNGKDFTGWTPAPTKRSLPNFWIVRDGALVDDGEEGANLMTVEKLGRRIWVVVNGRPVITEQTIPGTTGSAIDGDESAPGPIMLQGEEQRVEFGNITVSVPRSWDPAEWLNPSTRCSVLRSNSFSPTDRPHDASAAARALR